MADETKPKYRAMRRTKIGGDYDDFMFQSHNVIEQWMPLFLCFGYWKEVERERIPEHAVISNACLGYSGWNSPLMAKYADVLQ